MGNHTVLITAGLLVVVLIGAGIPFVPIDGKEKECVTDSESVTSSFPHAPTQDAMDLTTMATRGSMTESENNNQASSANTISSGLLPCTVTGTLSTSSDPDWFKVSLTGGSSGNQNLSVDITSMGSTSDSLWIGLYAAYPNGELHMFCCDNFQGSQYSLQDEPFIWSTYTGSYYIEIMPVSTQATAVNYQFVATVGSQTPVDTYNDIGSAKNISTQTSITNELVDEDKDGFDWFGYYAPDPAHYPTNATIKLDMLSGLQQTMASSPTNYFFSELTMFLMYEVKTSPGTWKTYKYYACMDSHSDYTTPKTAYLEANFTRFYIGICSDTHGDDGTSNKWISEDTYQDGWARYSLTLTVIPLIPNSAPVLINGTVTPENGRTENTFTYNVRYKDVDNDPPAFVKVTVDLTNNYFMTKKSGEGSNYIAGVVYEANVLGSTMAEGPHYFNFSATDSEAFAMVGVGTHNGPLIDDNNAPYAKTGVPTRLLMNEDEGTRYVSLTTYFEDSDGDTLAYSMLSGTTWASSLTTSLATYDIQSSNATLKIELEKNQYGEENITLNVTDGKKWVGQPLTLTLNVTEVNDAPVLAKLGGKNVLGKTMSMSATEDTWFNITAEGSDPIDGDNVTFNVLVLKMIGAKKGTNFDFDPVTGAISIKPSDADVLPGIQVNVSIDDGREGRDWVIATISIANSNDAPVLKKPTSKDVTQFGWLNLTLSATDDDLDSGDSLSYYTDIATVVPGMEDGGGFLLDPVSGIFSFNPRSQECVGVWNVTFGVEDAQEAFSEQTIAITVKDLNERPFAKPMTVTGGVKNLTVVVSTLPASDVDGDTLTYIWNLGDGMDDVYGVDLFSMMYNYTEAGTYNITLVVTDGFLSTPTQTYQIRVTAPGTPSDDDVEPDDDTDDDVDDDINVTDDDNGNNHPGGETDYTWLIILIIALVILTGIIIIVLVVVKSGKKKKKKPAPEAQQQAPPPQQPAPQPTTGPELEPTPVPAAAPQYQPLPTSPAPAAIPPAEEQLLLPPPQEINPQTEAPPAEAAPPPADVPPLPEAQPPAEQAPAQKNELDSLFGDTPAPQQPPAQPEPPAQPQGPAFGEAMNIETVESPPQEPAQLASAADPMTGQTIEIACHNCGQMMGVTITQRPQTIVCWNCQAEGLIE